MASIIKTIDDCAITIATGCSDILGLPGMSLGRFTQIESEAIDVGGSIDAFKVQMTALLLDQMATQGEAHVGADAACLVVVFADGKLTGRFSCSDQSGLSKDLELCIPNDPIMFIDEPVEPDDIARLILAIFARD